MPHVATNLLEKLCDRTVLCAVAALLTVPALAGGGLSSSSRAFIQLTTAAVLALWSMRRLAGWAQPVRPPITSGVTLYGLVLLALVTAPLVPLPPALVRWLSPRAFDVYRTALPSWPEHPPFGDLFAALHSAPPLPHLTVLPLPASWRALSLVPYDSWATLGMGLSYAVLGAVVALYPWGHELRALRWLVIAVIAVAVFEAAYAFVQQANGDNRILWFECPAHATCTGTYLNRNHFAGLLEMVLPLLVAYAVATWRKRHRTFGSDPAHGSWVTRSVRMLALLSEPAAGRAASLWCLALLVVVALAASGSRSAFLATGVAIALTTAGRFRAIDGRGRAAAAGALLIGAAVWLLFPQFTERVGSGDIARAAIAADTLDMTGAFPLFGVGIGNFGAAFPLYRRRTIQSWAYGVDVDHAHNDYLEWLSEVGLPAFVISLVLLGVLVTRVMRADREHRATADETLLSWGFATGAVALLIHGFTDFNLHIPANALVFTFLVGALVRLARRRAAAMTDHGPRRQTVVRGRTPALVALAVSVAWMVCVWQRWDADAALQRLPNTADALVRSLWADPVQPRALLDLARTAETATAAPVLYDLVDRAAAMAPYDPPVRLDVADWYLQRWASLPADVHVHATTVVDAALALTAHLPGSGTPRQRTLDAYLRVAGAPAPLAPAAFVDGMK